MTNVLVCIKRVPDLGGEISLTADAMSVDDSSLGHTVSPHEDCAVELAIQTAKSTDGEATVLTLGSSEAVEQLRTALALGCTGAVHIEADPASYGPADVAAAIAEVVRAREAEGSTYDLVLLGNDASDTGDFQVGIRLSYLLDRPVVTGVSTLDVAGDTVTARGGSPDGVEPRYPSIPGRMKAKKITIDQVAPTVETVGSGRIRLKLPEAQPSQVSVLGEGPEAAAAVVDLLEKLGVTK
jgi:electron transfer flavoprotein beta subunit